MYRFDISRQVYTSDAASTMLGTVADASPGPRDGAGGGSLGDELPAGGAARCRRSDRAVAGQVDYRLARNAVVSEFRKGRLSRLDVCDAHPELLRAATNVRRGDPRGLPDLRGGQGRPGLLRLREPAAAERARASPPSEELRKLSRGATGAGLLRGRGLPRAAPGTTWPARFARRRPGPLAVVVTSPPAPATGPAGWSTPATPARPGRRPAVPRSRHPKRSRRRLVVAGAHGAVRRRPADRLRHRGRGLYLLSRIPLPSAAPLKPDDLPLRRHRASMLASFSEREPGQRLPQPGPPGRHQRRRVDRGPALLHATEPSTRSSIVRAFISDIRGHGNLQGASTITQQYVKTDLPGTQAHVHPQDQEAALAIQLQRAAVQEPDPRELPQHHLLGAGCLRGRGCIAGLLRQGRRASSACPRPPSWPV